MSCHHWTQEEREFIKSNYGKMSAGQIALKLRLRVNQIHGQILLMKLKKK